MTLTVDIAKTDAPERIVFGWASVAQRTDGTAVVDSEGHRIALAELERAAYGHVEAFRAAGVDHQGEAVGTLVESMVFTPEKLAKMGLPADALPGGWWVGYRVDPATFARVTAGELRALSIQGKAQIVEAA